jgi:hypothetical protein
MLRAALLCCTACLCSFALAAVKAPLQRTVSSAISADEDGARSLRADRAPPLPTGETAGGSGRLLRPAAAASASQRKILSDTWQSSDETPRDAGLSGNARVARNEVPAKSPLDHMYSGGTSSSYSKELAARNLQSCQCGRCLSQCRCGNANSDPSCISCCGSTGGGSGGSTTCCSAGSYKSGSYCTSCLSGTYSTYCLSTCYYCPSGTYAGGSRSTCSRDCPVG